MFVKDKIAAKQFIESLSRRGYQFTPNVFKAENAGNLVVVFPLDTLFPNGEIKNSRLASYSFDEILIPSWMNIEYEKLVKSRLKPIVGFIKIYKG